MSFNFGEPSNDSIDKSSSDDEFDTPIDFGDEEAMIEEMIKNRNILMERRRNKQSNRRTHGGSTLGHRVINRDRVNAENILIRDYFAENPLYPLHIFRRRFRMSRTLFLRVVDAVMNHDSYFQQRRDATGKYGLSTLQKCTAAIRVLAYSKGADAFDEYLKIGESTILECAKRFCRAVVEIFSGTYLRSPNANDIARLLYIGEQRGFPGMLGSLDCMHWKWKNCPTGWAGQYSGRSGAPTIILEAVADYDLWFWHANFGMPGSNNDVNVLDSSNLFSNLEQGISPPAHYTIQGKEYNMGYYLADGIYPKWSTIVQSIHNPHTPKMKHFTKMQEACRKDVERAFGVLQARFHIVGNPVRYWDKEVLRDVMSACIIMHNMIIEDERDLTAPVITGPISQPDIELDMVEDENERFQNYRNRFREIRDKNAHIALRNALIEHLWEKYSNNTYY